MSTGSTGSTQGILEWLTYSPDREVTHLDDEVVIQNAENNRVDPNARHARRDPIPHHVHPYSGTTREAMADSSTQPPSRQKLDVSSTNPLRSTMAHSRPGNAVMSRAPFVFSYEPLESKTKRKRK